MPTKNPFKEEIQQLQTTLAELEADTVELQQLHDERAAQVAELATSRDFARRAELEGQRAAFEKMLGDQQGEVQRTRDALATLEREAERDSKLAEIGSIATRQRKIHSEITGTVDKLIAQIDSELPHLMELESEFYGLHTQWTGLAAAVGLPVIKEDSGGHYGGLERAKDNRETAHLLYGELRARGVDVDALLMARMSFPDIVDRKPSPVTTRPVGEDRNPSFSERLTHSFMGLYRDAWQAWNTKGHHEQPKR